MQRFLRALVATFCVFAALAVTPVRAQFPSRAVTLVVPFAPGGDADIGARLIAAKLTEYWGRAVLVDNKPGTAGVAGAEAVAKAQPDGHTLLMGNEGILAINPALYKQLPYDPARDFVPVTLVAEFPLVLLVPASTKAQSPRDLVALIKPKSAAFRYSSSGNGSVMHLAAVLFENVAKVQLSHTPYASEAQAISDLIAGHVRLTFAPVQESLGHITSGRLRALAVTSAQRSPALPRLQTIAESGLHGYEAAAWIGVLAPAATPGPAVEKIARDVSRAVASSDVRHKLDQKGAIAVGGTPAQFKTRIDRDRQRYARLIEERAITIE